MKPNSLPSLAIPVPLLLAPVERVTIGLVGCGGTGSAVAQYLARLAWHTRRIGLVRVELLFIDGDVFTEANIGRTLCCPNDVGKNKAAVLAARHNMVWGLDIQAVPQMATEQLLQAISRDYHTYPVHNHRMLLLGAVDTAAGRRAMHVALHAAYSTAASWHLLIDSGNTESAGQVLVGSVTHHEQLAGAFRLGTVCTALPAPGLMAPALLEDTNAVPIAADDCTTAMTHNRQSLVVNQQQAAVVAQYIDSIVNQNTLSVFQTDIVTNPVMTVQSHPITVAAIAQMTGLSRDFLMGTV